MLLQRIAPAFEKMDFRFDDIIRSVSAVECRCKQLEVAQMQLQADEKELENLEKQDMGRIFKSKTIQTKSFLIIF